MTARDAEGPGHALTIWGLARERPDVLVVALLLVLAGSGLALLQPVLVGRIVELVDHDASVLPWIAILVAVAVVQVTAETVGGYLQQVMGERGSRRARSDMGRAILRAALTPLARLRNGDLVSRFTTDADTIREGVARGYIQVVTAVVTALGAGTMLWLLDTVLFLIVAAVMIVSGAGAWLFLRRIEAVSAARQETLGAIGASVDRVFVGIRTIRVFHATNKERAGLSRSFDLGFEAGKGYATWTAAVTPAVEIAATGSFLALVLGGGMRLAADQISLATLVSALLYSTILVVPIGTLIEATISLSTAKGALARINEVISLPDESEGADRQPISSRTQSLEAASPRTSSEEASGLHIRGLSARYDAGPPVLHDVSLHIPRGHSLLVRGHSGSGKTTLVNVICRFLPPQTGRVLLNGHDLLRLPPAEARRYVTIAEQDSPLLGGTVRDTLAYGAVHATDPQMLTVLEQLGLLGDLGGPDRALERELGEHGRGLSGGQRQRLALARALLADRPLLIVDEPTSGLDGHNRRRVISALQHRSPEQTLLIISHDEADRDWVDQTLDFTSAASAVKATATARED